MNVTGKWWLATFALWFLVEVWIYTCIPSETLSFVEKINNVAIPSATDVSAMTKAWQFITDIFSYNISFFTTSPLGMVAAAILTLFSLPVILTVLHALVSMLPIFRR
jgi:hypothetical protein